MLNPPRTLVVALALIAVVALVLGLAKDVGFFGWSLALLLALYLGVAAMRGARVEEPTQLEGRREHPPPAADSPRVRSSSSLAIAPAAFAGGAGTSRSRTAGRRQPRRDQSLHRRNGHIVDDEQDVFHITALPDGTLNLTGHSTVNITFTPDDPGQIAYQGHEPSLSARRLRAESSSPLRRTMYE